MKKIAFLLSIILLAFPLSSESYIIKDFVFYIEAAGLKILGKTRQDAILKEYPIDRKKVFSSSEELEQYIDNYKIKLESSRAFESILITHEITTSDENDTNDVYLKIDLKDSHHMLAMPYPSYSSSNGLSLTLKAKDTNFLGTLSPMTADIKLKLKDGDITPSFFISYNYPFKIKPFDVVFINEYELGYTVSDVLAGFNWKTKTGFTVSLPLDKITLIAGFTQLTTGNLLLKVYNDYPYFTENFYVSSPITITELSNYTPLVYTPTVTYNWNWDFNGINIEDDGISSPEVIFSHSLTNSKLVWKNHFRTGYSINLTNSFTYNLQRNDFIPFVSFEAKGYWNYKANEQDYWDRYGICADFYTFAYFDLPINKYTYGIAIGERLRGIKDTEFFGNTRPLSTTSAAIMFSIDLPHHIFTTTFKKEILNFSLQFSPFFDMALVYDRVQDRLFHPQDGYYCAGLEILVYPLKWSSITIRGSLGIDLKNAVKSHNFLEAISSNKEIFIGIGLQY